MLMPVARRSQLEMNARKEETSQELTQLDKRVMVRRRRSRPLPHSIQARTNVLICILQDLNSKFTILLGEARTEIEATKWISTRASSLPPRLAPPLS